MRIWIWGVALLLLTAVVFERNVREIYIEQEILQAKKEEIKTLKDQAISRKEKLELQIMSQSDPRWITLTLIRVLGVVPEGQTKYYFKS